MSFDVLNQTRAVVDVLPTRDADGRTFATLVAKYRFEERKGVFEPETDPKRNKIDIADTFNGDDPAAASIRKPSQLFDQKPGTDVVLLGHAHPLQRGQTHVDVTLRVGPIRKTIRAFGTRAFKRGAFGGVAPGPAMPIREPIPLLYELAFGGSDVSDPSRPLGEPRNLVGRGIRRRAEELVDTPAHQLEYAGGDDAPASFGAIHRHWQPRARWAGTYDERWMESRMPLLPEDFDPRFHVCVPEDQWSPAPLRSNEPIEVTGATPEGTWRIELPRLAPGFSAVVDGKRHDLRTHLDLLLVDADERAVELTYRASLRLPPKWERVGKLTVLEKQVV